MVKFLGLVVLVTLVFTLACQEPTLAPLHLSFQSR